jgi:hypothetical protein
VQSLGRVGGEETGGDGVDGDTERGEFGGEASDHAVQTGLGGDVARNGGASDQAHDGGDHDDTPGFGRDHEAGGFAGHAEIGGQV